jgi:hypothetical protein
MYTRFKSQQKSACIGKQLYHHQTHHNHHLLAAAAATTTTTTQGTPHTAPASTTSSPPPPTAVVTQTQQLPTSNDHQKADSGVHSLNSSINELDEEQEIKPVDQTSNNKKKRSKSNKPSKNSNMTTGIKGIVFQEEIQEPLDMNCLTYVKSSKANPYENYITDLLH